MIPTTQLDSEPIKTVDERGAACPGLLMDLIGVIRDPETQQGFGYLLAIVKAIGRQQSTTVD